MNAQTQIKIGSWTASPALNLLERENRGIKIERRAMDVLAHLAERSGEVVSVEELLAAVWQGVVVSDSSVYLAIKQLRQALAIPGDDTVYIETIPKRGYRLKAPVERLAPERALGNARPLPVAHDGSASDSAVSARPRRATARARRGCSPPDSPRRSAQRSCRRRCTSRARPDRLRARCDSRYRHRATSPEGSRFRPTVSTSPTPLRSMASGKFGCGRSTSRQRERCPERSTPGMCSGHPTAAASRSSQSTAHSRESTSQAAQRTR